jgi:D-glycero-alpha-D-manno-heptose-7-phosphate kinase
LNKVSFKSPTRVDLAGGTLDMWPLYNFVNGATTINVAIDIWTEADMTSRSDRKVIIRSSDLQKSWQFESYNDLRLSNDPSLVFYKTVFKQFDAQFMKLENGFDLNTSSQSPIGGGLGGSSSLVISLLKVIYKFLKIESTDVYQLVHLAHNIEAEMLKTPTGTQDYFPAVTGGLSFIDYGAHQLKQSVFSIANTPFEDHFLLVYTGKSHHSGLNNFEVLKSAVQSDENVMMALQKIKDISKELKTVIMNRQWEKMPELFQQEYAARIQLTPAFSSPEIEKLARICMAAGALAVKICGAGGGGCVLVWVAPDKRESVVSACRKESFQCLDAKPVNIIQ